MHIACTAGFHSLQGSLHCVYQMIIFSMCILSHKIWQEKVPGSGSSISEISTQEDSTGWSHGDLNRYPYNDWSAGLLLELVLSMNECALIPSSLSLSRLHSLLTNSLQIKVKQQSVISFQHVHIYFMKIC